MTSLLLILKFFGGLILLFAIGCLVGHLFKLDKYVGYKKHDCNRDNQDDNN